MEIDLGSKLVDVSGVLPLGVTPGHPSPSRIIAWKGMASVLVLDASGSDVDVLVDATGIHWTDLPSQPSHHVPATAYDRIETRL